MADVRCAAEQCRQRQKRLPQGQLLPMPRPRRAGRGDELPRAAARQDFDAVRRPLRWSCANPCATCRPTTKRCWPTRISSTSTRSCKGEWVMADILPDVEGLTGQREAVPAALVSPTGTVYEAGAQMAQKKCAFFDVTLTMDTAIHLRCGRPSIYAAGEVMAVHRSSPMCSNRHRSRNCCQRCDDALCRQSLAPAQASHRHGNLAVAVTTGGAPTHTSQASCSGVVGCGAACVLRVERKLLARQRQTEQCTQEYTPPRPRDVISEVLTEELWIRDRIEDGDRARAAAIALGLCTSCRAGALARTRYTVSSYTHVTEPGTLFRRTHTSGRCVRSQGQARAELVSRVGRQEFGTTTEPSSINCEHFLRAALSLLPIQEFVVRTVRPSENRVYIMDW